MEQANVIDIRQTRARRVSWFYGKLPHTPGRVRRGRRVGHYCPVPRYFVRCLWAKKGITNSHRTLIDYIQFQTTAYSMKYEKRKWCKWDFKHMAEVTGLKQNLARTYQTLKKMNIILFDTNHKNVKINYVVGDWDLSEDEWTEIQEIILDEFPRNNTPQEEQD